MSNPVKSTNESMLDHAMGYAKDPRIVLPLLAIAPAILFRGGKARRLWASGLNKFLKGFYGKGRGQFGKAGIFSKELAVSTPRLAKQVSSPRESFAFNQTGLSSKARHLIAQNERAKQNILAQYKQGVITDLDKAKRLVRSSQKMTHHQLTSDFRNNFMYYGSPKKRALDAYINRLGPTGKATKSKPFVEFLNKEGATVLHGADELEYISKVHLDVLKNPIKFTDFALYNELPIQQVLRAGQFDSRLYKIMTDIEAFGGKESIVDVIGVIKKHGLPFKELKNGKVAFNISPRGKPNYDWGGHNHVSFWEKDFPGQMRFAASDRPDIFGVKLGGRSVLNLSTTKRIKLPEAKKSLLKDRESLIKDKIAIDGINKTVETNKALNITKKAIINERKYNELKKAGQMTANDRNNLRKALDEYDRLTTGLMDLNDQAKFNEYFPKFVENRAGIIGGGALVGAGAWLRYKENN